MDNQSAVLCVNCGSASSSMALEEETILHCIQQWTAPRLVHAQDLICKKCWSEAKSTVTTLNVSHMDEECALCHVKLPRRKHQVSALRTDTTQHVNIRNILLESLDPLQDFESLYICHPCWQKADRAAKRFPTPTTSSSSSSKTSNTLKCANCRIDLKRMRRHILNDDTILLRIQQRVAPQVVCATDYICDACYEIFNNKTPMVSENSAVLVGHQNVCIECGRSVAQKRHTFVQSEENQHILNVVRSWIHPREIQPSDVICYKCFQRADAAFRAEAISATVQVSKEPERITLPNYSRAPDTHSRCIFPSCNSTSQQLVPITVRVKLFRDHNYYIPPTCRICSFHLQSDLWPLLYEAEKPIHSFTAAHIEDFGELIKRRFESDNN